MAENEVGITPENLSCPIPDCQVAASAQRTVKLGQDLAKAVRKLRWEMVRCQQCPQKDHCAFHQYIDRLVLQAISDAYQSLKTSRQDRRCGDSLEIKNSGKLTPSDSSGAYHQVN
jgi:hypothetical protein